MGDLAIVGASATGKSALAAAIRMRVPSAEVVSVDAMAVYRGFDLLAAKPPRSAGVHLVDLVDVDEEFSVADFAAAARSVISQVHERGNQAVLVGGTGLYQRAVLGDLDLPGRFPEVVERLEAEVGGSSDLSSMHERLSRLDPVAAARIGPANRRRILRALEVTIGSGRPFSSFGSGLREYPPGRAVVVGLRLSRPELYRRLDARLDAQLAGGLLAEVEALAARPRQPSRTASQAIGYRELRAHLDGELPLDEAVEATRRRLRNFARRQEAWFRRDPRVIWVDADAPHLVDMVLGIWCADPARDAAAV